MYKTFVTKPAEVERDWWVVDAKGQTLGRLATQIATILRGKHKPTFAPNVDVGDFVVVINADKFVVSGKKMDAKFYHRHSNYPGGLTSVSLRDQLKNHPERVIEAAVRGMLPKNTLGRETFKKLKIYTGDTHPHAAQKPKVLEIKG